MDSVPLAAIDKALRATVAEGDLSHGKLLKDRLEWALYYDRLGVQAKARILYFRALNDVISVTETVPADEPHRYGRLGKLNSLLMDRMATLEGDLRDEIRLGKTPDVEQILRSLNRPVNLAKDTPLRPQLMGVATGLVNSRAKLRQQVNKIVKVPALMLGNGLRAFVTGNSAQQFQSTFKRKASVRRVVLGSQLDLSAYDKSIRQQMFSRKRDSLATLAKAKQQDILDEWTGTTSPEATFLQQALRSQQQAESSALADTSDNSLVGALALQVYHSIAFSVVFPIRSSATTTAPFASADVVAFINYLSSVLGATPSQRSYLVQLAEKSAKVDKYNDSLIVDDLKAQLAGLPGHPFYALKAFASDDQHKRWLKEEQLRLDELIANYVNNQAEDKKALKAKMKTGEPTRPPQQQPAVMPSRRSIDYHGIFRLLAHILLEQLWKSQLDREKPQPGDLFHSATWSSDKSEETKPLEFYSPKIAAILRLFASRFGIGETFQSLCQISVLVSFWPRAAHFGASLAYELAQLERRRASAPITTAEATWLSNLKQHTHVEILSKLSRFKMAQPSFEELGTAVDLFRLCSPKADYAMNMLKTAIQTTCEGFLDNLRSATLAHRPAVDPHLDFLAPDQLLAFAESILEECEYDVDVYSDAFPSELGYLKTVGEIVVSKLAKELKALKVALVSSRVREDSGAALDLLITLNGIADKLQNDLHFLFEPHLGLTILFKDPAVTWVAKSQELLKGWIDNAVSLDVWEPVGETEPYTTSVVDVFSMLSEILEYYKNFVLLEEQLPHKEVILQALAHVLVLSLEQFTDLVVSVGQKQLAALKGLGDQWDKRPPNRQKIRMIPEIQHMLQSIRRQLPGRTAYTTFKQKQAKQGHKDTWPDVVCLVCISANNCEMTRMLLQDILTNFEAENPAPDFRGPVLAAAMQPVFVFAKARADTILDGAVAVLFSAAATLLRAIVKSGYDKESCLDLFDFMNEQLGLFAESLYPQLLNRFLKRFAMAVLVELEKQVEQALLQQAQHSKLMSALPGSPTGNSSNNTAGLAANKVREDYLGLLESLRSFFHADGDGVPLGVLDQRIDAMKAKERLQSAIFAATYSSILD